MTLGRGVGYVWPIKQVIIFRTAPDRAKACADECTADMLTVSERCPAKVRANANASAFGLAVVEAKWTCMSGRTKLAINLSGSATIALMRRRPAQGPRSGCRLRTLARPPD